MTSGVTVRRAIASDAAAIAPLFDAYRQFYHQAPDLAAAHEYIRARLRQGESVIFVAGDPSSVTERLTGFVQLYPSFSSISVCPIWILNDLYVDAGARQHGIGRTLMEAAREFAASTGAGHIELSTAVDNAPARALYESLGYERSDGFDSYSLRLSVR